MTMGCPEFDGDSHASVRAAEKLSRRINTPPVRIARRGVCSNDGKVTLSYCLINLPSREVSSRARAIFRRSGIIKGITHMLSTEATLIAPLVWV